MGKYGDEGDKLIFKILNNGLNNPEKEEKARAGFEQILSGKNSADVTERALKYDLTIPFARYVAMNHNKLTFPFRRYQLQPVWRADKPQHGRYREFTQCDADVVGSNSLINEIELANIYHEVFIELGLKEYELRINSRKILAALAEFCGGADKIIDITVAIDKLDKIGLEKVNLELANKGLTESQITTIEKYLNIDGSNEEKLALLKNLFGDSITAAGGIDDLSYVAEQAKNTHIIIDLTLARGLNYYTGIIFEAKPPKEVKIGSIGGGGRYDDLTGLFEVPGIPGVGISFGVDRIYDVLENLNLFPANLEVSTKALFFNMGKQEASFAFNVMQQLRQQGVSCEMYHEEIKIAKQFTYAERKDIPYAIIIGSREMAENNCQVKNLSTGQQQTVALSELAAIFNN